MFRMRNTVTYHTLIVLFLSVIVIGCEKKDFATQTYFISDTYLSITLPEKDVDFAEKVLNLAENNKDIRSVFVDNSAKMLKDNNVKDFIINYGGTVFSSGSYNGDTFPLGIADPLNPIKISETIGIKNKGAILGLPIGGTDTISISVIDDNAVKAYEHALNYSKLNIDEIKTLCAENNTPTLLFHKDGSKSKLCSWEKTERK